MATDWTKRIRLRHLEIFIDLAKSGNISVTAETLNMTQPGISRWLKELEDDIGLPLFERHTRGLRLTSHGQTLLQHAEVIMNQLNITKDDLSSRKNEGSGVVNIGLTGAVTANFAPKSVVKLLEMSPNIQLSLLEGTMDMLVANLLSGSLDIVLGRSPQQLLDNDIEHEVLYTEPIRFVVNPQHPLLQAATVKWSEMYRYPWLIWPKNTPLRQDLEKALMHDKKHLPSKYIESNSLNLNIQLLSMQDFICVLSLRTAKRFEALGIVKILDVSVSTSGSVSLLWRKDSTYRHAVQTALSAIRQSI
ncbi:LysR family transcriptional regulator [Pelistega suis]|uniref:LysR family transcriptional regulator n=1 Tax=Pelistega suis TaxID=1631957 RepID=UPI00211C144A|nr:LysR substrate-binding domain-containing protein [Pelistega suis]MCQ9329500.1 LysR substrate-binding domain-containing protein [Pelistega suis]